MSTAPSEDRRPFWWALGMALLVRLPSLIGRSVDLDEATSAQMARLALPQLLAEAQRDIHPPLFYLLLWPLRAGVQHEWILRLEPLLAGIALLAALWQTSALLERPVTRRWSIWLCALSPFAVLYTTYARSFALVTALCAWGLVAALVWWRAARQGEAVPRWAAWTLVLTLAAACWTFYFALPFTVALMVSGLWMLRGHPAHQRSWLLMGVAVSVLFAPWLPVLLQQNAGQISGYESLRPAALPLGELLQQAGRALVQLPNNLLTYQLPLPDALAIALWLLAGGLVLLDLWQDRTDAGVLKRGLALTLLLATGLILLLFLPRNIWLQERYTFLLLPGGWLLVESAVERLPQLARLALAGSLGLLMALSLVFVLPQVTEDFRGAATLLAAEVAPDERVIVISGICTVPLEYYWPAGAERFIARTSLDVTDTVALKALTAEALPDASRSPRVVWLVVSHDRHGTRDRGGSALAGVLRAVAADTRVTHFSAIDVFRVQLDRG